MRLFLVRHAEAAPGNPDELRPLTPIGREQARALGERLAPVEPAVVLSSPLLRARETASAIARATGAELRVDERLAPGATLDALLMAADGLEEPLVAVGHQPDCGEIAAALTGGDPPAYPPAGVAELDLPL
ncbi:MAG: histidine phosphatase family protein [Gaiellaceae bacterium MAG52_C11]|nr:histidine phosphatase family protein [Candidatus Gaiellasilicea maunaloa]